MKANKIAFGGGTAIALANDEYRVSVDIDLMVSDKNGFRTTREQVRTRGLGAFFNEPIEFDLRQNDKYAIRAFVFDEGVQIKFEIVLDAYLELIVAPEVEWIAGVPTLSRTSLIAEKLLANADRWQDSAVFARDILDLAVMHRAPGELNEALELAADAYDSSIGKTAVRAIDQLLETPGRLARCLDALTIEKLNLVDASARLSTLKRELEATGRE